MRNTGKLQLGYGTGPEPRHLLGMSLPQLPRTDRQWTVETSGRESPSRLRLAFWAAAASICLLCLGSLLGIVSALFFGSLASAIALVAAYGMDRRQLMREASLDEAPIARERDPLSRVAGPSVPRAPARDFAPGYYVPDGENENALNTLVILAPPHCPAFAGAVSARITTRRVPAGVKYYVALNYPEREGTALLCLRTFDDDRFGRAYHAKMRNDLLHGAEDALDVELTYRDGHTAKLEKLDAYQSAPT